MAQFFARFSNRVAVLSGSYVTFILAVGIIVLWAVTGPLFDFSNTWQLAINTGTTIITFLMVFLIQNTQNRDAKAIHLKLDELIWAIKGARNHMIDLEHMSDQELEELHRQFIHVARLTEHNPSLGEPPAMTSETPRRAAKKAAHAVASELKKRGAPSPLPKDENLSELLSDR